MNNQEKAEKQVDELIDRYLDMYNAQQWRHINAPYYREKYARCLEDVIEMVKRGWDAAEEKTPEFTPGISEC